MTKMPETATKIDRGYHPSLVHDTIDHMSFSKRLREAGLHTRFQTITYPITRDDDPGADDGESNEGDKGNEEANDDEGEKDDGSTLRGLAVPFNSPTRIVDFFDEFDEQFEPGSFKRTIGMGHQVMLFNHGDHPLLGSIPIADIRRLEETGADEGFFEQAGLEYTSKLFDNWMIEPLRDAIRSRAITGNSIQFRVIKETIEEREDDVPLVTVQEAELREFGPVLFPAYTDTPLDLRHSFDQTIRRSVEEALRRFDEISKEPASSGAPPGTRRRLAQAKLRIHERHQ